MMNPRTNPSGKRQKVPVISDSRRDCNEAVITGDTSVTRDNLMGQRNGIVCDDVTVAVTVETRNNPSRQISEIWSDAQAVADTRDTRKMMGSKDKRRDQNYQKPKEDETLQCLMKKAGFGANVTVNGNFRSGPFPLAKKSSPPYFERKVKPLSSEESVKLFASLSKKRRHPDSFQRKLLHVQIQRNERQTNQSGPSPRIRHVLAPREKVLETLNHFRMVFEKVDRDKAARRATYQTDLYTRDIVIKDRKHVNRENRVGVVPGVEVGDKFKYKSQLSIIGLHFSMSRGIDYMKKEGLYIATSIVISEGSAYNDEYNFDVVSYCGEGDYSKRKKLKPVEDQKLTRGNLALANSMREKKLVRLIIGRMRMDRKEKQYIYVGLYSVLQCWEKIGPLGNRVFKFKLIRLPGQASIHLSY